MRLCFTPGAHALAFTVAKGNAADTCMLLHEGLRMKRGQDWAAITHATPWLHYAVSAMSCGLVCVATSSACSGAS
jgi:hypothetical protein